VEQLIYLLPLRSKLYFGRFSAQITWDGKGRGPVEAQWNMHSPSNLVVDWAFMWVNQFRDKSVTARRKPRCKSPLTAILLFSPKRSSTVVTLLLLYLSCPLLWFSKKVVFYCDVMAASTRVTYWPAASGTAALAFAMRQAACPAHWTLLWSMSARKRWSTAMLTLDNSLAWENQQLQQCKSVCTLFLCKKSSSTDRHQNQQ
jgi:hypothetical protein